MVTAPEIRDLLEDRPDLEPAVEAVLEPDEPWSFAEVDVDSGAFGELVSHGVVEHAGEEYRVADRAAVRAALDGAADADATAGSASRDVAPSVDVSLPAIDRLELALLVGALLFVVAFRLVPLPTVFRGGDVVLSANDPYFYRYWVETMLSDPGTTLSSVPSGIAKGEPLLVATLWLATVALGGTAEAAGHVMAWYPVVSAVVTAGIVYWFTKTITDDRRIGLAAVLLLAVLPAHAYRTSLGFADHHPFDYPWLALTVLGIVVVADAARRPDATRGSDAAGRRDTNGGPAAVGPLPPITARTVSGALAVGVGVGAQTLAWDNSPLLLAPLGLVLSAEALRAVRAGESPLRIGGPVLLGAAVGAGIAWAGHAGFGWHTTLVASAPTLVVIGGVGVLAAGELAHRFDVPTAALAGVEAVGLVAGTAALAAVRPDYWSRLTTGVTDRLLARRDIAEVQSLFGESVGWLLLFGFILLLALPYMAWGVRRALDDGRWLVPTVYAWYFLVMSAIQVRFVGELAPVIVVFAGLGFVHLAERVDVARRPVPFGDRTSLDLRVPSRETLGPLVVLFLLVTSLSIVQVPVKTSQLTVAEGEYETASWIAEDGAERGLEYPESYVFSFWPQNRMYNYFVSGESESYAYARNNYEEFVRSREPRAWYNSLDGRAGYVVTTPGVVGNESSLGARLHDHDGNRTASTPALVHYRLVHSEADGEYKVFELVPGAVVEGSAESNATVTLRTDVAVEGASFTYVRQTTTGANGTYSVRVSHPGEYRVAGGTVEVPESAVRNGTVVSTAGTA
ncbi:STT3 domain-containing protein [Halorarum halobium]|uniref:STT3 domain-containing protein n=1 Tax=Halorarum halobium TaxID=3075121 RepID=UPI0028A914D0|nr:STT3 domain-containing protein [Halobaculum sp. XH14]